MAFIALGLVALAIFASLGRRPLAGHQAWRVLTLALSLATAAGAVWAGARGEWLGAVLLIGSTLWLAAAARPPKPPRADGDRAEAAAMLGVSETATVVEIEAAYRRLMLRVHPDQGGAPGLAAQLNRARDTLMAKRR